MSSANIQAKIKKGLAKAVNKTGSSSSELVYLVQTTVITPGSPVSLPVGDIIKQGVTNYIVIDLGESSPTSDVLNYNPQVREQ